MCRNINLSLQALILFGWTSWCKGKHMQRHRRGWGKGRGKIGKKSYKICKKWKKSQLKPGKFYKSLLQNNQFNFHSKFQFPIDDFLKKFNLRSVFLTHYSIFKNKIFIPLVVLPPPGPPDKAYWNLPDEHLFHTPTAEGSMCF